MSSTEPTGLLPSWRPGPTRDAIVAFLDACEEVPIGDRFACFDNDGTLWAERPSYVQLDFFLDALRTHVADDPSIADRPEFAAVLSHDAQAMGEIGLEAIAIALAGLFDGLGPDEFTRLVVDFMATARHAALDRPLAATVYQPMLELLDELRRRQFTIAIVTGGGTEFVRAVSDDLYGVPPELVVGTLIGYEFTRDDGRVGLRRTIDRLGHANEGPAKVTNIQTQLGRRPILAGGNSGGDREMLEWACSEDGPCLALLVDHDDAEREYEYVSTAQTFAEDEPILDVAGRLGWVVASMRDDWSRIFPTA